MSTIGKRISDLRRQKGMTQEALAEMLNVSSQAVSKWEHDLSCPDISLLPVLADIFGCTTDQLLTGKSETVTLLPPPSRKPVEELILRIIINSSDGDKVRVNLPLPLIKWGMECGTEFLPSLSGSDALKSIDWGSLLEMVQMGIVGKLIEIESADGDTVEIVAE